ncbi:SET domain-containing protein [Testicularia cyperi]|uniref:SET domain-containing protein n=1 Tax=Testicularia cyperi TaxID=1882483 RepID=A0A317XYY8_9BASI|nr:SET domain-containing protein [Testicularia cyperi]
MEGRRVSSKLTLGDPIVKALSKGRRDPAYFYLTRSADKGQSIQKKLRESPPTLFPEHDARNLVEFFQAWVEEMDKSHRGLAICNPNASDLGDVVPPWNFAWVDEYLLDPSVVSVDRLPPPPVINGFPLTDERMDLCGCSCENDICDPVTCECFARAIHSYPYVTSSYARQIDQWKVNPDVKPKFPYDDRGLLRDTHDVGAPIFECHSACGCDKRLCGNRVVQQGRKRDLAFFKTEKKGWGIQTLETLPKGTFVGIYGGELLNDSESERRATVYDHDVGVSYLQNIDVHVIKAFLTQRLVEEQLALEGVLDRYRGSPEKHRMLAELVTKQDRLLEGYDEYLLSAAPPPPTATHSPTAGFMPSSSASTSQRPLQALPPEWLPDESLWDFVQLSRTDRERIKELANRRSDLEDVHSLIIDSALFGNHTRFFNHSCEPNLSQYPVYCDQGSIFRPWLAFFTTREVESGEELCFNYYEGSALVEADDPREHEKTSVLIKPKSTKFIPFPSSATSAGTDPSATGPAVSEKCQCGAKNCVGRIFVTSGFSRFR